jgi:hypothetical protein
MWGWSEREMLTGTRFLVLRRFWRSYKLILAAFAPAKSMVIVTEWV